MHRAPLLRLLADYVRFLFRASAGEDFVVSEESHDLAWVPLHRLRDYTAEESVLRLAAKSRG